MDLNSHHGSNQLKVKRKTQLFKELDICDATPVEALSIILVALFKNPLCKLDKVALGVKTTGGPITAKPQF